MEDTLDRGQVLATVPLLSGLNEEALARLAGLLEAREYKRGESIFAAHEPGDAMYIVSAGVVKVWMSGADNHEIVLDTLGRGAFFGEMSLLDDAPRSAHVTCLTEATLLRLGRQDFIALLESDPTFSINLVTETFVRLRRADATLRKLHDTRPQAIPRSTGEGHTRSPGRGTPTATLSESVQHAPGRAPLAALAKLDNLPTLLLSGKERMKFLARFLEEEIPFHRIIGVRVVSLEHGVCVLRLPYQSHLVGDPLGAMLHGSVGAVLAEGAGLGASYTLLHNYEDRLSTVSLDMDYSSPAPPADLFCEAHVVRFEQNMVMVRMALYSERLPKAGTIVEPISTAQAIFSILRIAS